ncbi:MAG: DUF2779 domain-containing protein [Casimicrobium sp.]|jgi:hypothetical protein
MVKYLSKSKLVAFRICPKRLWLEVNAPTERADSATVEQSFKIGHEVGEIAQRLYDPNGKGALVSIDALGFDGAFRHSKALLTEAKPVTIFEAGFRAGGALAFADIMIPTKPRSAATSWHMIEVKSATEKKAYHEDDVAIQAYAALQSGVLLASVKLAHIDKTWVYTGDGNYNGLFTEVDLTATALARQNEVATWVTDAHSFAAKTREPKHAMGKHCKEPFECGYVAHCQSLLPAKAAAKFPVTWIPRVQTSALKNRIVALAENAREPDMRNIEDKLLNDEQLRVKAVTMSGETHFDSAASRKALRTSGKKPMFLDFETINFAVPRWTGTRPRQQYVPFQFAANAINADGTLINFEFLDVSGDDPRPAMARALAKAFGGERAEAPVFAYNMSFERACLEHLAEAVPRHRAAMLGIAHRLDDLLPITRDHYYHPDQRGSWSIKSVLPTIAPELDYAKLEGVQHGQEAQEKYLEAIDPETTSERKAQIESQLKAYCGLDSYAMVVLWAKLAGRKAPQLQRNGD